MRATESIAGIAALAAAGVAALVFVPQYVELFTLVDVAVYCIGYLNPTPDKGLFGRFSKSGPEKAREALAKISEETGGKPFFPQKLAEMGGIVNEIAHELRNQYSIGYVSSNTAKDGSWRRVKIALEGPDAAKYHVRSRTGYFAPKLP